MVRFPQINRHRRQIVKDFTANIYLEGEYNQDIYDLQAVEEALKEWTLDGFIPDDDVDTFIIKEVLVSGGAVWQ